MNQPCSDTTTHPPHNYATQVETQCDGKTECGAWSHSPHVFQKRVNALCTGICECGAEGYSHCLNKAYFSTPHKGYAG